MFSCFIFYDLPLLKLLQKFRFHAVTCIADGDPKPFFHYTGNNNDLHLFLQCQSMLHDIFHEIDDQNGGDPGIFRLLKNVIQIGKSVWIANFLDFQIVLHTLSHP